MTTKNNNPNLPVDPKRGEMTAFEELFNEAAQKIAEASQFSDTEFKSFQLAILFLARKELKKCTPVSILKAAAGCALCGLSPIPELHQAYIYPYGTEATLVPGYRGKIVVALDEGVIEKIQHKCVFRNDYFRYVDGMNPVIEHIPWYMRTDKTFTESGDPWTAWVIATLPNGSIQYHVTTPPEIERAKKASKGGLMWKPENLDVGILKTAIHNASKSWGRVRSERWVNLERAEVGTLEVPSDIVKTPEPLAAGKMGIFLDDEPEPDPKPEKKDPDPPEETVNPDTGEVTEPEPEPKKPAKPKPDPEPEPETLIDDSSQQGLDMPE